MAKNEATKNKLSPQEEAELKKAEDEEAAAKAAAEAAAKAANASPPAGSNPHDDPPPTDGSEDFEYPPDAPHPGEPVVPLLEEWLEVGYSREGYNKRFGLNPKPNTDRAKAQKQRTVGDIAVVCLKSETSVHLGNRRYQFVQGQEILMDPGHAEEMRQSGWVQPIDLG